MTSPLIDFIEARLEEDRALAQAAVDDLYGEDDCFFDTSNAHICDHYLRHQPSRVLREVAAKRAILAAYRPEGDPHPGLPCTESIEHDPEGRDYDEYAQGPCERHVQVMNEHQGKPHASEHVLRYLAAPYSNHPDFDPNWSTT